MQDSATLTDNVTLDGTGSITFNLYGPGDTTCAAAVYTETVKGISTPGPFGTTTGYAANVGGTYEWTASFSGDANNSGAASGCGSDPVTVGKATPTLGTQASPTSTSAGSTLQDSATLADNGTLDGTASITFNLYGPGDTTCASTAVYTESVNGVSTAGPLGTTTGYVANAAGTYEWTASFSGDSNNNGASSACGSEPVTVGKASPTLSTQANPTSTTVGSTLQNSATLAGNGTLLGTGSVTFNLYGPGDMTCASTAVYTETVKGVSTAGPISTTTGYVANVTGTYEWTASFSGDANNSGASSACGSEFGNGGEGDADAEHSADAVFRAGRGDGERRGDDVGWRHAQRASDLHADRPVFQRGGHGDSRGCGGRHLCDTHWLHGRLAGPLSVVRELHR